MRLQSGSTDLEDCPVPEELLKRLLEATISVTGEIATQLSGQQRAALAVYCYRRSHFRRLGLRLAAQCEKNALVQEAGHAGEVIFNQSRAAVDASDNSGVRQRGTKAPVSLYTV